MPHFLVYFFNTYFSCMLSMEPFFFVLVYNSDYCNRNPGEGVEEICYIRPDEVHIQLVFFNPDDKRRVQELRCNKQIPQYRRREDVVYLEKPYIACGVRCLDPAHQSYEAHHNYPDRLKKIHGAVNRLPFFFFYSLFNKRTDKS